MSCILRISGDELDIDAMVSQYGLHTYRVWRKGESKSFKGKVHEDSGASFVASDADFDEFSRQVTEAVQYLEEHAAMLALMTAFPGVQAAVLDFGVSLTKGYVAQFCYLPPRLVQLAASATLALEISQYACSDDVED